MPQTSSRSGTEPRVSHADATAASTEETTQVRRTPDWPQAVTASVVAVVGICYAYAAWREELGTMADTGPGLFPFLVAALLVPSALVALAQALTGRGAVVPADEDDDDFQGGVDWPRIAGVLGIALLVPLVGSTVGLVTSLAVATGATGKVMGMRGWLRPVLLGAAFGASVWLVFVYWLYVPLPAGRLGLV